MLDNYVRLSEGKSVAKNIDILGWRWQSEMYNQQLGFADSGATEAHEISLTVH